MSERVQGRAWWICMALLLATMLNYMDRQTLSLTATTLKTHIHLNDDRYGQLEQYFSWAFAGGSIIFGFLADRWGPRYLYPLVLIGWSLAGMAAPLAIDPRIIAWLAGPEDDPGTGEFRWLLITRTTLGLFESGHWPCALMTVRAILTAENRPFGNSILQSGASIGAIATPLVVQLLVRYAGYSWQVPFLVIGILGVIWIPIWFLLIRTLELRRPPEMIHPTENVTCPRLLLQLIGLATFVTGIGISWQLMRAWLAKYLKESRLYSEDFANLYTIFYFIAADLGCLGAGYLVKSWSARGMAVRTARIRSAALCALACLPILCVERLDTGYTLLGLMLLFAAGILGLHPHYYSLVQDLPKQYMGVLSGSLAAFSWFVVGGLQKQIGKQIEATASYHEAFLIVGLAPVAAWLAMILIPGKRS